MLRSVTPTEDLFSITWNLGPRCNFECSYCPPKFHSKTARHMTLAEMVLAWEDLLTKTTHRNKRYKISFSGGEITINPDFLPFLEWLRKEHGDIIANIGFTTNGSAGKNYYLRSISSADWITFSSHHEFMNSDKFKRNVLATHIKSIKLRKNIFVNIMAEDFARHEVDELIAWCDQHRIPHSEIRIHWDHAEG